jgi:hypothetical protein
MRVPQGQAENGAVLPTSRARTATGSLGLSAVASLVGLAAVVLGAAAPRDPGAVAAVFPPWWSQVQALNAAATAGDIQRTGGLATIVVIHGDPKTLADRLRRAGALLLLDPVGAGLCAAPNASTQ